MRPSLQRIRRQRNSRSRDDHAPGGFDVRPVVVARRNGAYGVDAPYLLPFFGVLVLINILEGWHSGSIWPFLAAGFLTACAGFGLYASLRGKFVVWAELLDGLALRGNEQILDLGCGRGAVLLMAAQHLTTGRAVGVDIWRKQDQFARRDLGQPRRNPRECAVDGGPKSRIRSAARRLRSKSGSWLKLGGGQSPTLGPVTSLQLIIRPEAEAVSRSVPRK